MLSSGLPYDDRQPALMSETQKKRSAARHMKALAKMGYRVQLVAA